MKKETKIRNDFHIRVHDVDVAKAIEELMNTNQFDNANVLLNTAVAIGIESLLYTYGLKKSKSKLTVTDDSDKIDILTSLVKGLVRDVSELLIGTNIQELLTALCFNMQYEKDVKGTKITSEMLESGILYELPSFIENVKSTVVKNRS